MKKQATGWGYKGLSKSLFKGNFGLTDETLRNGIPNDDVSVVTRNGVVFCRWRFLKPEHMDEKVNAASIKTENAKATAGRPACHARLVGLRGKPKP